MPDSEGFSVEIPRAGSQIEYVEFGYQPKLYTTAPLALVKGPFKFGRDKVYECSTECGTELVIIHLKRGKKMNAEEEQAFEMLTGEKP